jgi:hypothetical protein
MPTMAKIDTTFSLSQIEERWMRILEKEGNSYVCSRGMFSEDAPRDEVGSPLGELILQGSEVSSKAWNFLAQTITTGLAEVLQGAQNPDKVSLVVRHEQKPRLGLLVGLIKGVDSELQGGTSSRLASGLLWGVLARLYNDGAGWDSFREYVRQDICTSRDKVGDMAAMISEPQKEAGPQERFGRVSLVPLLKADPSLDLELADLTLRMRCARIVPTAFNAYLSQAQKRISGVCTTVESLPNPTSAEEAFYMEASDLIGGMKK